MAPENAFRGTKFGIFEKGDSEVGRGGAYEIRFIIVDRGGNEIAIGIHCDAVRILTKAGSRSQIGICGFLRKQITGPPKNVEFRQRIDVSWVSNESPRVSTSSFSGGKYKQRFTASTWTGC